MVARIDGWLAQASRLRDRVNGCAVKASFHEQSRCDVEQPDVTRLSLFPGGTAPGFDVRKLRHRFLLADDEFFLRCAAFLRGIKHASSPVGLTPDISRLIECILT